MERERFLLQRLTLHVEPQEKFINAFLRPPLYSTAFTQGFGTLYTAVYRPWKRSLTVHWPKAGGTFISTGFSKDPDRSSPLNTPSDLCQAPPHR